MPQVCGGWIAVDGGLYEQARIWVSWRDRGTYVVVEIPSNRPGGGGTETEKQSRNEEPNSVHAYNRQQTTIAPSYFRAAAVLVLSLAGLTQQPSKPLMRAGCVALSVVPNYCCCFF